MSSSIAVSGLTRSNRWTGVLVWPLLLALLVTTLIVSLASGRFSVPAVLVARILAGTVLQVDHTWSPAQETVVLAVRLPRALLSGTAGAVLALAGGGLQGVFRNPLVGPQTIGISSGAALGGVAAIFIAGFGPAVLGLSFAGAAASLAIVLLISRAAGGFAVLTLVLAGIVVGAFAAALVSLATFFADPETKLPGIVFWLMGSFAAADWPKVAAVVVCALPPTAMLFGMRWRINVLSLGDEDAAALGVRVARDRVMVLACVCLMIAAQVAVSGVVAWVGLVMPHVARLLVGPDHRRMLPVAALLGGAYLMSMDTLSRTLTAAEVPVGIMTALLGAPVFAVLLARAVRQGAVASG
jgi:iron complex transport system permease protein